MAPINNMANSRRKNFQRIATISGITGGVILATGLGVGLGLQFTTEDKESTQYKIGTGILAGGSILGAGAIVTSLAFLSLSQSNDPITTLAGFQGNVVNEFVSGAVDGISSGIGSIVAGKKREEAASIKREEAGKIISEEAGKIISETVRIKRDSEIRLMEEKIKPDADLAKIERIKPDAALSRFETGVEDQMRIKIQPGSEYMAMLYGRQEREPYQQTSM